MQRYTKYLGFTAVGIEWVAFMLCLHLHSTNWSEPLSQFGYYHETRLIFGATLTAASLCIYFFARHLDRYWPRTSIMMLLAGICLSLTGWIPYEPYAKALIFDLHNAAITLATVFFSLPMLFISFQKNHSDIALASRIIFFVTALSAIWSVFARTSDNGIIYVQFFTLLTAQIWVVITNALLLSHYKQGKLDSSVSL